MSSPKLLIALGIVLGITVIGLAALSTFADSLFYYPNSTTYAVDYDVDIEDVTFAAPDGPQLHGWWLPAVGEQRGTVVYCHGNAANVTLHTRNVAWLPKLGYAVFVFDYRGYGKSQGSVTRAGTVADAVAAIDFALKRDPDRTVVFGHSLGGAIGISAAAQRKAVRAVIAESTFPSYRRIAGEAAPLLAPFVPLFVAAGNDPIDVLKDLPPRPLLVIHGEDDPIVPAKLGRELYDAASEPKQLWLVPKATHFSPWHSVPDEFERRIDRFFRDAIAGK